MDDASAEAGREEILSGDLLQGKLVQSFAILPLSRDASGEYSFTGGERQAREAYQGLRSRS